MDAWMFDFGLLALAVLLMVIAVYKLLFSADQEIYRDLAERRGPRLDRREPERSDRRRSAMPAPSGLERRQQQRR